jgi:tRNA G46 methylase TrmB
VRSDVLRGGRMGSGQQRALSDLAPRFVLPFREQPLDWASVFGREAPRVLEIGFGMGDATAAIAAASPGINFLGVEVAPPPPASARCCSDSLGSIPQHGRPAKRGRGQHRAGLAGSRRHG